MADTVYYSEAAQTRNVGFVDGQVVCKLIVQPICTNQQRSIAIIT